MPQAAAAEVVAVPLPVALTYGRSRRIERSRLNGLLRQRLIHGRLLNRLSG